MKRLVLVLTVLALTGCGSKHHAAPPKQPAKPGPGRILYQGSDWAVTVDGTTATAFHLAGGSWLPDRGGDPKIDILGPKPGSKVASIPQVAFQAAGTTDLVDTAMWVDGVELLGKGGGLTPKHGTIYGAPAKTLAKGTHVAVAYARTATHATAVAWTFRV